MGFFPIHDVMHPHREYAGVSSLIRPSGAKAGQGSISGLAQVPHPPVAAPAQALRALRRDGLWSTLGKATRLLSRRVLRREHLVFFANDVADVPHELPAALRGFRFVLADASNIAAFRNDLVTHFRLEPSAIDQRLAAGKEAMLALHQGRVVAIVWLAFETQTVDEIGMKLRLLPGEYLTFDAVTLHAWRGRGLSRALNLLADNHVASRGIVQHLAWRSASNTAALRVADKLGQRRIASATATWVFGRMVHRRIVSLNRRGSDTVSCLMGL
jgi:GNAT superfamily N-acetyltransferase